MCTGWCLHHITEGKILPAPITDDAGVVLLHPSNHLTLSPFVGGKREGERSEEVGHSDNADDGGAGFDAGVWLQAFAPIQGSTFPSLCFPPRFK